MKQYLNQNVADSQSPDLFVGELDRPDLHSIPAPIERQTLSHNISPQPH